MEYIPNSWNFGETFRIFRLLLIFSSFPSDSYPLAFILFSSADPFLANVAVIVFIYYTSVVKIIDIGLLLFC